METIHVAYAIDDNYTEMTCVSMASMLFNTKNPIRFHVIESRLSEANKNILEGLKDTLPHGEWTFYNINNFDESMFKASSHYTVEIYYRLLLPELLPELGKIIYIDGDTVVDGDITELWQIDLNEQLAGAIPALYQNSLKKQKEVLGIDEKDMYFNSGVLLLNLAKLRDFDLFHKAFDVITRLYKIYVENGLAWCPDQEILNYFFNKNCLFLLPKYNFGIHVLFPFDDCGICLEDWRNAFLNPVIIHYICPDKPSVIGKKCMQSPLWETYYKYKAITPYANIEFDNKKIEKYHFLEKQLDNSLVNPYDYIFYKKHALFIKLADKLPGMCQGKKLVLWGAGVYIYYLIAILSTKNIYADVIVDGEVANECRNIFHYTIQNPEILQGKSDEYFVLLSMINEKPAASVGKILTEYGYEKNGYHHVFAPLWAIANGEL